MDGFILHNYEITINNKLVATSETIELAEELYSKKLTELIEKHTTRVCEEIDEIKLIDVDTLAIIKQETLN